MKLLKSERTHATMLFLVVSASCALIYALSTVVAERLRSPLPPAHTFEEMLELASNRSFLALCWVVLLSMFFVLAAYVGIAVIAWRVSPPLALLGMLFCTFFVLTELLYRSVELFAVIQVWIPSYQRKPDEALRLMITGFDEVVNALYFVLLMGHGLGSALLGFTVWPLGGWARLAALALLLNALRISLRILEMHVGWHRLSTFNARIYAPLVVSTFLALAFSLVFESHLFP